MRMKAYISLLLCVFCLLSSCQQDFQEEVMADNIKSRSTAKPTFFTDIKKYEDINGNATIEGTVFCPEDTEYTITFAFQGTPGVSYDARFGNIVMFPSNGENFRKITTTLRAGTHYCCLRFLFSGENQMAEGRIVIDKVNGSQYESYKGMCDLSLQAKSNIIDGGGSESVHWTCQSCGFLNSKGINVCMSCGKSAK